ncbi:hypothetical protein HAX54_016306 [Datura stramonium]|uniref:Uncharacterized protein n=1 Tax=Datura stramonium TaxID=4076 RepID=A0ABS8ULI9_DATST|nr:hypothetical protein [Datura stramonium]
MNVTKIKELHRMTLQAVLELQHLTDNYYSHMYGIAMLQIEVGALRNQWMMTFPLLWRRLDDYNLYFEESNGEDLEIGHSIWSLR